jgi:hypothetical protein
MEPKEVFNLQEAYLEVYSPVEELTGIEEGVGENESPVEKSDKRNLKSGMSSRERQTKHRLQRGMKKGQCGREYAERQFEEHIDLYDVIFSHLLDEGFVDTEEAAEVVMVNMSEEWRNSIIEAKKPLPISKMKSKEAKLDTELEKEMRTAMRTPIGSPERLRLIKKNRRFGDMHDVRRSISTRGGKRPLEMPEVGRYKPKYDED